MKNGVYAASLTPLNNKLEINVEGLIEHCQWLLRSGCNGIALFGTTGEANSFSVKERRSVLESMSEKGIGLDNFIVGTGCCALPDTVELTQHALMNEAGGVLVLPPFYYKSVSDEGLYEYFDRFIQTVGDDQLRIFLYHFPGMTGLSFSHSLIDRLIKAYPGIIAGLKDSGGDYTNMKALCEKFPDFQVFAGTEKYLYQILQDGGAGCISATVNITSKAAGSIYSDWINNQDSHDKQELLTRLRLVIENYPFIPALKQIIAWYRDDDSWLNLRPPHVPLLSADTIKLKETMDKSNLFSVQDDL